jgi:type I restriction enzyme S subunit
MSLPQYPEYKASSVDWLGEVPEHWDVLKLKRICALRSGDGITSEDIAEEGDYPVYGGNGLRGYTNKFTHEGRYALIGRQGALCGNVNYADGKFWASEHAVVVSPIQMVVTSWLGELLRAMNLNQYSITAAQPGLAVDAVGNLFIPLPPDKEQQTIAAFLDRETGKIDALIAEQQRLVELLAEKRQAVISHAVTKGLNPNAKMKDSGIEWMGEVPAHWDVTRLKTISPFISVGIVVNPSEYVSDEGLPYIYGGDISVGKIAFQTSRRITERDSRRNEKTRLSAGDLLTVRVGAPGITAVVPPECEGGNCASVMYVRKGDFNSDWLCYAMNDKTVRYQVEVVQYGAAQEQFNISHAINFWIVTPPREEQNNIAAYLDTETAKFDTLTAEANRAIELLQERRSALISAAVTGKIKVTDIQ